MRNRVEDAAQARRDAPVAERERVVRRAYRRAYRWVAVTDVATVGVVLVVAYWIRFGFRVPAPDFLLLLLLIPFAVLAAFTGFHLYEPYRYAPAEEFRRIVFAVSAGIGGISVLSFWSQSSLSRLWVGLSWVLALLACLAARRAWHAWLGRQRMRGHFQFPTVIVGTNDEARRLAETLGRPALGFRPIGMVTTSVGSGANLGMPVLGRLEELRDVLRETGAECVFVAASAVTQGELAPIVKAVRLEDVEVRITATLPEVLASRLTVQPLGGITALSLRPARLSGGQVVLKFAFDIVVSAGLLLLMAPFMAGIAVAVKVSSSGPVLYRQRRVGLRGRPFTMLKFRTMQQGADREVERLRAERGVEDVTFKLRDDPRVTRAGRWLRAFSLDELPQLLNVLRGDMSLVGPRPPLPEEVAKYEDWHFDRLEAPPGITGLWQISGRSDLPFDDSVRLDLFYLENWSLAYDAYILAKTVPIVLTRRGAY